MQSKAIIEFLNKPDSVDKLKKYWDREPSDIVLRASELELNDRKVVASLLSLYKKNKEKLPEYVKLMAALNDKSSEQCSSEKLAAHKAQLFEGALCVNMCGGLGVDDLAFSRRFKEVISFENDPEIHELAVFNFKRMGVENISRRGEIASNIPMADLIYADPDRRTGIGRNKSLHGLSPDILTLKTHWLNKAPMVLLKLSPMTDLTEIRRMLPEAVEIRVVSMANEVKEILVILSNEKKPCRVFADIVTENQTIRIGDDYHPSGTAVDKTLFVEPALALLKSGLDEKVMLAHGLHKVSKDSAFYVGNGLGFPIPGRAFEIVNESRYQGKLFDRYLKDKGIVKGHFKKRGFPLTVEELRSKHKLKEGGDDYFFFYTLDNGDKMILHGKKAGTNYSLF